MTVTSTGNWFEVFYKKVIRKEAILVSLNSLIPCFFADYTIINLQTVLYT